MNKREKKKCHFVRRVIVILFLFSFNLIFSQKSVDSITVRKYLEISTTEKDLIIALKLKKTFPSMFKYFPDINPIYPGEKQSISSGLSKKRLHPIYKKYKAHNGIDIVAKKNAYVYATADGVVKRSVFFNGAAGHSVELVHDFGFRTRYFHLSIFLVKNGERVRKGQIIGLLGNTGSSTAPHLHYEIWKGNKVLNPTYFINSKL